MEKNTNDDECANTRNDHAGNKGRTERNVESDERCKDEIEDRQRSLKKYVVLSRLR